MELEVYSKLSNPATEEFKELLNTHLKNKT